jgi:hypothetical protein
MNYAHLFLLLAASGVSGAFAAQLLASMCGVPVTKNYELYQQWAARHPYLQRLSAALWPLCSTGMLVVFLTLR